MNRKLRNTILAFSVTGMVLAVGLMAAHPVVPGQSPHAAGVAAGAASAPTAKARTAAATPAGRIEARVRVADQAALVDAEAVREVVALTVDLVAIALADSLKAARALSTGSEAAGTDVRQDEPPVRQPRSRGHTVRNAIAVPYFSFARGAGGRS